MGITDNQQRDTKEFGQQNRVIGYLVEQGFNYSAFDAASKRNAGRALKELVQASKDNCPDPAERIAYGWKRPVTIFATEMVLDVFPDAKAVHLIRDGRDVMLSRLDWRMSHLHNPLNRLVVFGDPAITSYRGKPLTIETVNEYRNEIEMHHWVTAVRAGMRGRMFGDRYLEIRYEDLCREPVVTLSRIFDFLEVPFSTDVKEWIPKHASTRAIGKWRGREDELADAIAIGAPLLKEHGYV